MLGPVLILGALGLFLFNMKASTDAEADSTEVLLKLHQAAQKMPSEISDGIVPSSGEIWFG